MFLLFITSEVILAIVAFLSTLLSGGAFGIAWTRRARKRKESDEIGHYYALTENLYAVIRELREKHRLEQKKDHNFFTEVIAERDTLIDEQNVIIEITRRQLKDCTCGSAGEESTGVD